MKTPTYSLVGVKYFFPQNSSKCLIAQLVYYEMIKREITLTFDINIRCQKYLQSLNTDDINKH